MVALILASIHPLFYGIGDPLLERRGDEQEHRAAHDVGRGGSSLTRHGVRDVYCVLLRDTYASPLPETSKTMVVSNHVYRYGVRRVCLARIHRSVCDRVDATAGCRACFV